MILGEEQDVTIPLPIIQYEPDSGNPQILDFELTNIQLPEAVSDAPVADFIDIDINKNSVAAKSQNNLSLLDQTLIVTVSAELEGNIRIATMLEVRFVTEGPKFEKMSEEVTITCSAEDKGFNFDLPSLVLAD